MLEMWKGLETPHVSLVALENILHIVHMAHVTHDGSRNATTCLKIFVVVIPKEGPILLWYEIV